MPIVKIKTCDAEGKSLANQFVKVSGCEQLTTNADGLTQFLIEADTAISIALNGATVWSGNSGELKREETFCATASGFVRL